MDVSKQVAACRTEEDLCSMFYHQNPYLNFYPFDIAKHTMQFVPAPLLLESYRNFNIVRYANYVYGIAQALGTLDITQIEEDSIAEYQKKGMWFSGNTIEEIKKIIDERD